MDRLTPQQAAGSLSKPFNDAESVTKVGPSGSGPCFMTSLLTALNLAGMLPVAVILDNLECFR
jgi:hypothetical protein